MDEKEIKEKIIKYISSEIYSGRENFLLRNKRTVDLFEALEDIISHKFDILKYLTLNPKNTDMELYYEFPFLERFTLKELKEQWIIYYNIFKLFDSERTAIFKELPEDFYNSKEYAEWGIQILKRFNYRCVYCKEPANHTDHLRSARYYPELALNIENGIALCEDCHKKRHGAKWGGK